MRFLPAQSVNDLRLINGDGTVMTYLIEPGEATSSATNSPSAVTWTPPV